MPSSLEFWSFQNQSQSLPSESQVTVWPKTLHSSSDASSIAVQKTTTLLHLPPHRSVKVV